MKQFHDTFLIPFRKALGPTQVKNIIILSGVGYMLWFVVKYMVSQNKAVLKTKKQSIISNRQALRDKLDLLEIYQSDLLHLLDKDLSELRTMIQNDTLHHMDLFRAYQVKALQLDESGKSAVAEFVVNAESEIYPMAVGRRPALYGIPISINECCGLNDCASTLGLIKYCNEPKPFNSTIVKSLIYAGAIPFVATISSQFAYSLDGYNPIYGSCTNPIGESRMSGCGSCGECVLVASRASAFGIGMDVMGGIRIPAAFCGLVSLKPASHRLSTYGTYSKLADCVTYLPKCVGPIGRKTEDITQIMRCLLTSFMFNDDPTVLPMYFDEMLFKGSRPSSDKSDDSSDTDDNSHLRIGYYESFYDPELVDCTSTCQNAVREAVEALHRAGHRTHRFDVPEPKLAFQLVIRCLLAHDGRELCAQLEGEPLSPHLKFLYYALGLPSIMKIVLRFLTPIFVNEGYILTLLNELLNYKQDAFQLSRDIVNYRQMFMNDWCRAQLDALVCPVFPSPALPKDASPLLAISSMCYAVLYNLLDMPAGTVPVGYVKSTNVQEDLSYADFMNSLAYFAKSQPFASVKGSEGLPLSVQVVSPPHREEVLLRIMQDIENHLEVVNL